MQSCLNAKAVSHDSGTPTTSDRDDSPTREEQQDMMELACPSPCASMTVCSADNQMCVYVCVYVCVREHDKYVCVCVRHGENMGLCAGD